jgi:hypothetical protein
LPELAAYLSPEGQLGVGIQGGLDTIVHLSHINLEKHISTLVSQGKAPTRALLLLDIVNMFNSCSREADSPNSSYLNGTQPSDASFLSSI